MKKFTLLGRLYKSRRNRSQSNPRVSRRLGILECLEDRRMLAAASFPGNFAPPDLVIPASVNQNVTAGQQLTLNLLTAGATTSDKNSEGGNTGDAIRLYLDPDVGTDTPNGATMTTEGVFTWTPTAAQVGTHRIVVIAVDSGSPALADAETFTVTVVAATPPAVVDLNGAGEGINATATFTEDGGAEEIASAATIADEDDTNLESATITLTNRPDGEDESLAVVTTGTAITANYNSTTGVLTLTGTDSVANYQQVLRTLTYNNVSQAPDTTARVVNVVVNDGTSNSAVATSTVTIAAVSDAPSVDLDSTASGSGSTASYQEDGVDPALLAPNAVIGDVDSANLTEATITLVGATPSELLEVTTTGTSITAVYTAETGVLALSGTDSLMNYQQVLRSLRYSSSAQDVTSGARTVTVVVKDGPNSSTSRTATINLTGSNDEPDIDPIADQDATIGILFELVVTASDPDGDDLTFELDRTDVNTPASATITQDNNGQATIRWTPTAADTEAQYTFIVLVTDNQNPALSDSEEFKVEIVTAPPSVDANGDGPGVDFAASFTEGQDPQAIVDTDLSVADFDSTHLSSATVTITNRQNGDDETLEVDTTDTAITANYADGVLTLSGSDTLANYEKVLRTLEYGNTSENPGDVARIVEIVVNDGTRDSAKATSTVSVAPENDPVQLVLPAPYNSATPVEVTVGTEIEFAAEIIDPDHTLAQVIFQWKLTNASDPIEEGDAQPDISETGVFTWTPSEPGIYNFMILVNEQSSPDNEPKADVDFFTITVVEAPAEGENTAALDLAFETV